MSDRERTAKRSVLKNLHWPRLRDRPCHARLGDVQAGSKRGASCVVGHEVGKSQRVGWARGIGRERLVGGLGRESKSFLMYAAEQVGPRSSTIIAS